MNLTDFVSKYFTVILPLFAVVALIFPNAFDFLLPHLSFFLMAIMFFVFLKIDTKEVAAKIRRPLQMSYIILLMMVVLPLVVFFAVQGLETDLVIGFLMIAAITPAASVLAFVDLFKGDLDLGLVIQVIYYLIIPFFLPVFFFVLLGKTIELDVFALFASLATLIFVPLIISQLVVFAKKNVAERLSEFSPITTLVLLGLIALAVVSNNANYLLANVQLVVWLFVACLLLLAFFQLATYYAVFFLSKNERKTVSVCKVFMNGTLALVIATSFFSEKVILLIITEHLAWYVYPFFGKFLFKLIKAN